MNQASPSESTKISLLLITAPDMSLTMILKFTIYPQKQHEVALALHQ